MVLIVGSLIKMEAFLRPGDFKGLSGAPQGEVRVPSTLRAAASLTGFRVPAGHVFWLATLQYYGNSDNARNRYARILEYCMLSADLNPHFIKIYEFGAGVLGFHVQRIDEAVLLLNRGIEANPQSIRLKLLLAAIGYQHTEAYDRIIPLLEYQVQSGYRYPMLLNILSNTYLKVGRSKDAVSLWKRVLKVSDNPEERELAARSLEKIYRKLKNPSAGGGKN